MKRYKITNTKSALRKGKKLSNYRKEAKKEISPFSRWILSKEMILVNEQQFMQLLTFWCVFAAIACDDHFFKPHFLNFKANYVECVDDATVAVQLEPTLIQAIEKGEFFRHKPSTFFSLISSKEDCTPNVNCIWCVNVCYVGKKHKQMSITSRIPLPENFPEKCWKAHKSALKWRMREINSSLSSSIEA